MENRVIPNDVIVCILTFLPVKSIIRFKSVCKSWYDLVSTPNFIKSHQKQFSSNPKNQSFTILRTTKINQSQTMYLFNTNVKKPINLDFPIIHRKPWESRLPLDFVGCYNGLICISLPLYRGVVLWNPVMKLSKSIDRIHNYSIGLELMVSVGFGYDDVEDDFKVVNITYACSTRRTPALVEVYSANLDSWTTIDVDFYFKVFREKNDAIVNGNPYWHAKVWVDNDNNLDEALVFFDVKKSVFKIAILSPTLMKIGEEIRFCDWGGCIGAIVCSKEENEMVESLDVWVFDDCEEIWRKNYSFGRIEVKIDRFMQCSKNGKKIVFEYDGKLFVFDTMIGCAKKVHFYGTQKRSFQVYGYTESLACIKGMKQLEMKSKKRRIYKLGGYPARLAQMVLEEDEDVFG